jgi:hypothetical protein
LDENEVLNLLGEDLKLELIVSLNSKMLRDTKIFRLFDIPFISELTFLLKRTTFSIEEPIFEEGD